MSESTWKAREIDERAENLENVVKANESRKAREHE
jgi:hypothetical protein